MNFSQDISPRRKVLQLFIEQSVQQNLSQKFSAVIPSIKMLASRVSHNLWIIICLSTFFILPSNVFGKLNVDKTSAVAPQLVQSDSLYVKVVTLLEEGDRLYALGKYNAGLEIFGEAYDASQSINVEDYRLYCLIKIHHGYIVTGKIDEKPELEEQLIEEYVSCIKNDKNIDVQVLLILASTVATILQKHDMTAEAIQLRNDIYRFEKEIYGNDAKFLFPNLYSLASLYVDNNDLDHAQEIIDKTKSLVLWKNGLEEECVNIHLLQCTLHNITGDTGAAIDLCEQMEDKVYQTGNTQIIDNYLDVYSYLLASAGQFSRALEIRQQQLPTKIKMFGKNSKAYAIALLNLSEMYSVCNQYEQALQTNLEALGVMEMLFGKESKDYYHAFSKLSSRYCHTDINKYWEIRKECVNLSKSIFGDKSLEYANSLIYLSTNPTDEDISNLETGLKIKEELGLTSDSEYFTHLSWLSLLYWLRNDWQKALDASNKALIKGKNFVASNFLNLLDWQREGLWQSTNSAFDGFPNYATTYSAYAAHSGDMSLLAEYGGLAYNTRLLQKGLLLSTSMQLENLLKSTTDQSVVSLQADINKLDDILKNIENGSGEYASVSKEKDRKQRELLHAASELGKFTDFINSDWRDVQKALSPDEVAIEFFSFPVQDKMQYGAVWMTSTTNPLAFNLFCEDELRTYEIGGEAVYDYGNPGLYKTIWGVLEAFSDFRNCKTVYFSADNILNTINIECLSDSTGILACDKRQMYRLSSTRELIAKRKRREISSAVLYGGLNYNADTKDIAEVNKKYSHTQSQNRSFDAVRSVRGTKNYLSGTLKEVKGVATMFKEHPQAQCRLLTDNEGTEESFYSLNGMNVNLLHISTHGFYYDEEDVEDMIDERQKYRFMMFDDDNNKSIEDKSMTRSGLILSGANTALRGLPIPVGMEDGILTSQEISSVNLEGLNLVVLSACQTGLGKVCSEGVFGLQRGFKKAGAQSLLMSLWKVNDQATCLLMTEFYKNLLSGKTKQESLYLAQKVLRESDKYSNPEYWAAFILLDALN